MCQNGYAEGSLREYLTESIPEREIGAAFAAFRVKSAPRHENAGTQQEP